MDVEKLSMELMEYFFGNYLVSCERVRGEASKPDLSNQFPITSGRELLLNAYANIGSTSSVEVRKLVERAEEHFELSYRSPVIDEQGYFGESRAQALMWLGITQSILGKNSQSFDSPQMQGPGFAFAEACTIFGGIQDLQMLGRVIQEWAESLLYVEDEGQALVLFTIAQLVFLSSGANGRADVSENRAKDMRPSNIDSAFLARRPVPGQEQMTTVLGCRNASELRRICIQADKSSQSAKESNARRLIESQEQQCNQCFLFVRNSSTWCPVEDLACPHKFPIK